MRLKIVYLLPLVVILLLGSYFLKPIQKEINPDFISGEYNTQDINGNFLGSNFVTNEVVEPNMTDVLGVNNSNKRIEVDLSTQTLRAFEDDKKVYEFLISSGKWGKTPTGTFRIWGKFRYTKMEGGRKELNTYYYLPNVPFVMFFENEKVPAARGFGIHGTYWHSNFGHPMSHGCINMKTEEAGIIYNWAGPELGDKKSIRSTADNLGTEVIIYGVAPKN